jgi:predicted HicB family RNase H-like nuclease
MDSLAEQTFMDAVPINFVESSRPLNVFLAACKEQGIKPSRHFSGKSNLRISPELREKLAITADTQGKGLNTLA